MMLLQNQIIADAAQIILLMELIHEQERRYPVLKLIRKLREQIDLFLDGQPPANYYPMGVF
jgi:hypothetical protein